MLAQIQTLVVHIGVSGYAFAADFLVIGLLMAFFFFFTRFVGRGQLVALFISLYTGYALYSVFPFFWYISAAPALTVLVLDIIIFIAFSGIAYSILRRIVVSDFLSVGTIGILVLSFFGTGFLIALSYHTFPVRSVYTFTPAIDALFAAKTYFFWWFIAPILGLFFLMR